MALNLLCIFFKSLRAKNSFSLEKLRHFGVVWLGFYKEYILTKALTQFEICHLASISDNCDIPDPSFEIQKDGKFYRVFGEVQSEMMLYTEAVDHCASFGTYLAMTRTLEEYEIMEDLLC